MAQQNSASRRRFYLRILFYPLAIIVFILVLKQLQKTSTLISQGGKYQYLKLKPIIEQQRNFDVRYYDLNLTIAIDSTMSLGQLQGATSIEFTFTEPSQHTILLNLCQALTVDSVRGAVSYSHRQNRLKVSVNSTDGLKRITVYYHGWPPPYHEWIYGWKLSLHEEMDGQRSPLINTLNPPFGAETWFPCKDDPADKADSLRIVLNIPDGLITACNGRKVLETPLPGGRKKVVWQEKYPISTYLVAVNIGKYSVFKREYTSVSGKPVPVYFYLFPDDSQFVDLVYTQLFDMLGFYESVLGEYPFQEEKYAMVIHAGNGGMENQTVTSIDQFKPGRQKLYAHELAHQWLGDKLTNATFHESWINEGLATYFTGLYLKYSQGKSAFRNFMKQHTYFKKGSVWVTKIQVPDSVYHSGRVYDKAAWFFYMLNQKVGDAAFFKTFRMLLSRYAFGNIGVEELQSAFEEISGGDLSRFFAQWIFEEYPPAVNWEVKIHRDPENGFAYDIKTVQKQKSREPYVLPVEVRFRNTTNDTILTFELFKRKQAFRIFLPFLAEKILVDPNSRLLMEWDLKRKE